MTHSNDLDFFNRIPVAGLLVNKIGRPNFIYNLKFLALVGYDDAQMSEIIVKDYTKVFNEEDIKLFREKLRNCEGCKKSVKQELKLTRSDSTKIITIIEAEVSEENDGNYVLCALTDITEIRKAQANYMLEQERLLTVIRNTNDDLFEYNFKEDLLKLFNKNVLLKDSFGDSRWIRYEKFTEMMSKEKIFHPEDDSRIRSIIATQGEGRIQVRMRHLASPDFRWKEMQYNLLHDDKGRPIGIVGSMHDIEELKVTTLEFKNKSQHDSGKY